MRILRFIIAFLFVAVTTVFVYVFYTDNIKSDKTHPTIAVEDDVLNVGLNVTNEELLKGVTAYDVKDGDISDKIIVESISKFIEKGMCNVTYAVCDNDHHVATAVRKIRYDGYKPPRFYMTGSLCFSVNKFVNISGIICAEDVIDGDISKNVIITSENFETGITGTFTLNVKVTNSKGDTISVELPIIVEERSPSAPVIELEKYLIYVKKGKKPDFNKYIVGVSDVEGEPLDIPVTVQTEFNPDEEGVYLVHYFATDADERQGHTILTVIVE